MATDMGDRDLLRKFSGRDTSTDCQSIANKYHVVYKHIKWVWLTANNIEIIAGAMDIWILHVKKSFHTNFGTFVCCVTTSWFFAHKPPHYIAEMWTKSQYVLQLHI